MVYETWLKSDLKKPMRVQPLTGNLFSADNNGNLIGVEVLDNGQPAQLTGAVTGYVIRADGATVTVIGTLSGNKASIILPASAYIVVGQISIVIKVGTVTVGACVSNVYRTSTDTIVDPGRVIPSISELLAEIENMRTATAAANTATENANTATINANTAANTANTAASNANSKATLANTAATSANTAAGKIDNMTVAASGLPAGSAPVATVSEVDGHKHILFQLPKGDKGDHGEGITSVEQNPDFSLTIGYGDGESVTTDPIRGPKGEQGEQGEQGNTGATPDLQIGTITTLNAGQSATASFTGTPERPVLNLGIPQGYSATINSQETTYATNSSSDTPPVSGWNTTIPVVAQGEYLWVKHTITWRDGNTSTIIFRSRDGEDGLGDVNGATLGSVSVPKAAGILQFPVDAVPTEFSTALITSGRIYTEIEALNDRIDQLDPESPSALFSDVNFSLAVSDWTLDSQTGFYNAVVRNTTLLTANAGIQVFYDNSFRTALVGDIYVNKSTGYVTFTTAVQPVGTLTGFIRIMDSTTGIVPVHRGGTGAATPKQARANLNAPIRDIPVDFGTVTSLPQTVYDPDLRANMVAFDATFSNPAAIPNGIDVTFADPSGNLGGSVTITGTISGETTIKFWAHEERKAVEGSETAQETQRVQDFVQTNAQTLTAAQKTQVLENIGAAEEFDALNDKIGKYGNLVSPISFPYSVPSDGLLILTFVPKTASLATFYLNVPTIGDFRCMSPNGENMSGIYPVKGGITLSAPTVSNANWSIGFLPFMHP